ncbi:hypothetical protein [Salinarimonas rosea]|uniref:hypothetical protein n=1 Tax=Salinarimonas rosea TaxID=552063 RepID=UPI000414F96D|nr:hypothetical protein [Salinarimonas rosea]
MRRFPSRPVALRTAATAIAGITALVALAGTSEAQVLRGDCFMRVAPACAQIRDVDAAHRCVVQETNACEAKLAERDRENEPPRTRMRALTHLTTAYSDGDPGGQTDPGPGGDGTPAGGDGTPAGGDGTPAGGDGTPAGGDGTPAGGDGTPAGGDGTPAGGDGQSGRR